jgi:hypothetical protein
MSPVVDIVACVGVLDRVGDLQYTNVAVKNKAAPYWKPVARAGN